MNLANGQQQTIYRTNWPVALLPSLENLFLIETYIVYNRYFIDVLIKYNNYRIYIVVIEQFSSCLLTSSCLSHKRTRFFRDTSFW